MKNNSFAPVHRRIILKPTYHVVNIVASADLQTDLDLYAIAKGSHDIDYEPEQFPGAIYKLHDPKAAMLLFKNGKMICTGCSTVAGVKRAIATTVEMIRKYKASSKQKGS